uniref:F-box only protein 22 isoform X2 n=1 Tax=Myxine glutinosa TaxID=7769 RepID=UPI00358FA424
MYSMERPNDSGAFVLSFMTEIVERIFSHLSAKQLLSSACVCHLWRAVSMRILRSRQVVEWVSSIADEGMESESWNDSDDWALVRALAQRLQTVQAVPQFVFYVADSEHCLQPPRSHRVRRAKKKARLEFACMMATRIETLLPDDCHTVGLASPGVIVELEKEEGGFALLFPEMEGVRVKSFTFSRAFRITAKKLQQMGLLGEPELRAVLLFAFGSAITGFDSAWSWRKCSELASFIDQPGVILAGGQVDQLLSPSHLFGKAGVLCISISGSAVRAASLLLDSDVSSFEQAENQLRGTALEPTPTLAFMFSCVGRGQMYYDRLFNVEADAFHRVYPKTPLFGFFGNGECGRSRNVWNLPGTSNSKDGSQDGSSQKLLHSFTTAFAFLHFGEPVLMARCTVDDNHLTTK